MVRIEARKCRYCGYRFDAGADHRRYVRTRPCRPGVPADERNTHPSWERYAHEVMDRSPKTLEGLISVGERGR
jgi:hypothetical protein